MWDLGTIVRLNNEAAERALAQRRANKTERLSELLRKDTLTETEEAELKFLRLAVREAV